VFDHIAQRQFINTVAEQRFFIPAHHAVIVKAVNPPFTETEGGRRQAEQANARIHRLQMGENLLILAVVVIADAVTLIHHQQGELPLKLIEVARYRLHAAEDHFAMALLALQPGGENIGFQPQSNIFGVVLRNQLLHVRQHQHATARQPCQLGNHQAFSGTGRQHNHRGFSVLTKMGEGGIHRFALIGA